VLDQAFSADSLIGLELSHYRIIEKIGSGGMGVVYRANDQHLDREVAIKVLTPGTITDEAARKHLRKEALALSKLNHPNIATSLMPCGVCTSKCGTICWRRARNTPTRADHDLLFLTVPISSQ
jgi:serine/threonine protein kinase